jgi:hypothetical protein
MRFVALTFGFVFFVGCSSSPLPQVRPRQPDVVAVADLLRNATAFEQTLVSVTGVVRIEFEGNSLYPDEASYKGRDSTRALWLDLGWPVAPDISALDGHRVSVVGTFVTERKGHFGVFAGSLSDVRTVEGVPVSRPVPN